MTTPPAVAIPTSSHPARIVLGLALLGAGCAGHLLAAHAIGGSQRAYGNHMLGFFGVAIITGAIIAAMGRWFWRGRVDITILAIGVVQALFGLYIYIERFNIH